jgi:hypothetical protein
VKQQPGVRPAADRCCASSTLLSSQVSWLALRLAACAVLCFSLVEVEEPEGKTRRFLLHITTIVLYVNSSCGQSKLLMLHGC